MRFAWRDRTATGCTLALSDSEATRARYPFGFSFTLHYTIAGATLTVLFTVENTGEETLPVSMGAHPAFRWPLIASVPKDAYSLTFATEEPGPLRSVSGGLLTPHFRPTPIIGRTLALTEALFDADALILPEPKSRSVRFAAETGPALTVSWDGFPQLGIWSRAGGDFLCIEPWLGMATPVGFCGEFSQKPWLTLIPRGQSRSASLSITVEE
jgi:galactose mutarotase-like enzyme